MPTRTEKPGDLLIDDDGNLFFVVDHVPVDRDHPLYTAPSVVDAEGNGWRRDSLDPSARRLFVIDLPRGALAGWSTLVGALEQAKEKTSLHLTFGGLIEQIQAQIRVHKPEEPTGLGAVVEDAAGDLWIRSSNTPFDHWRREGVRLAGREWCTWSDIAAVRVLSEGVTP